MLKLLNTLRHHHISVWLDNAELKLGYSGNAPEASMITQIKQRKSEMIAFLEEKFIFSEWDFHQFHAYAPRSLSFAQERLWFIEQLEPVSAVYHMPSLVQLADDVDETLLLRAINIIAERHPVLNACYRQTAEGEAFTQVLKSDIEYQYRYITCYSDFEAAVLADMHTPFDLHEHAPLRLCRFDVKVRGETERYLLLMLHHIAFDGWSIEIFFTELTETYFALLKGSKPDLPSLSIVYSDYAQWQRDYLQGDVLEQQLTYWRRQLRDLVPLTLPYVKPRPQRMDYRGGNDVFRLDEALSSQLKHVAKENETTLNVVMLSAFYLTLNKLSDQQDMVIGTPSANRHRPQTRNLIGFFVNTLALRFQLAADLRCVDIIQQVHQVLTQAKVHQELPFEQLVSALALERDLSRHPLFQVMFSVQHFDRHSQDIDGLLSHVSLNDSGTLLDIAKYDLSLVIDDSKPQFSVQWDYALSLFDKASIIRFHQMYCQALVTFATASQDTVANIDLLVQEDRYRLLHQWDQTQVFYPQAKTLVQLFEEQVAQTPDNVALVFEQTALTYDELNNKANQLAHYILEQYQTLSQSELEQESLIALYFEPSIEMVIAILAVLKMGSAYVPIALDYSQARTTFILQDTQAKIILTQQKHTVRLQSWSHGLTPCPQHIGIDNNEAIEGQAIHNLCLKLSAKQLAYVIYTSGTSGQPKGVMIAHSSVVNLVKAQQQCFSTSDYESGLLFASYVFDASVSELFVSLLAGHKLCICSREIRSDLNLLSKFIMQHGVDMATLPPALLAVADIQAFKTLKAVILAGESPKLNVLQAFHQSCRVFNAYGPTEASVCVTAHLYAQGDNANQIGKPIANVKTYVLDKNRALVPIGSVGELYVAGAGVARGYLNRNDLTRERFISNPFIKVGSSTQDYTRLYKTGDLVRYLEDGSLEYLGRNDSQVKIRGHRIELSEVEMALCTFSGIKQAVVIDKYHDARHYLAAYWIGEHNTQLSVEALQTHLASILPYYMLPLSFMELDTIPLTINGKLDRQALPEPIFQMEDQYRAPTNESERQLVEIWQSVLSIEPIGIHDNFFQLGGDSITAIRLSAVAHQYGLHIPLDLLFKHPQIHSLAYALASDTEAALVVIPSVEAPDLMCLSFAQERLWFIEQFEQGHGAYHMPQLVRLSADANTNCLLQSLNMIAKRHPILNSVLRKTEAGDNVCEKRVQALVYQAHQISDEHLMNAVEVDIKRPFNLTQHAPIRLCLYDVEPSISKHGLSNSNERYLLFVVHHIAFDGWSMDVFFNELSMCYTALMAGQLPKLPLLSIQYHDYAKWQRAYLQGSVLEKQLRYWREQLLGVETLHLPTRYPRPEQLDYRGADHQIRLDEAMSKRLVALARSQKTTLYTIMLSGFYLTLSQLSNQQDLVIGTPSDNRHQPQTQGLIGFFINALALRMTIDPELSYQAFIEQVTSCVQQAKQYQDVPFEKLVADLGINRDLSRQPIFQIMFSVQRFGSDPLFDVDLFEKVEFDDGEAIFNSAKYDLSLFVDDRQTTLLLQWNYALSLFNEEDIQRIHDMYINTLDAMLRDPCQKISALEILSASERHTLLSPWAPQNGVSSNHTIMQLFEMQVEYKPNEIALAFENETLTYIELHNKVNQLAYIIREEIPVDASQAMAQEAEITTDRLVGLYFDPSFAMIIAILATLKAGYAYVPISPTSPKERIDFMLADTQASLVLTQTSYLACLSNWLCEPATVSLIAVDDERIYASIPETDLAVDSHADQLAYIIYTSGTSGKPKGVLIEQRSVVNYVQSLISKLPQPLGNVDFSTNYCFDLSVTTFLCPLLVGAKVCIYSEHKPDLKRYQQHLITHQIDTIKLTPTLATALLCGCEYRVKQAILGGEALLPQHIQQLTHVDYIIDEFGPTETTVGVFFANRTEAPDSGIGQAYANTRAYVLGEQLQLLPIGTPGELYLGGLGLARGYLNCPELTAERFIENPFASDEDKARGDSRLYKTGDRVRYLAGGDLAYIGRNDEQVKIRGYRIELSDVEKQISCLEGVKHAVVIECKKENRSYLAAYWIRDEQNTAPYPLNSEMLAYALTTSLPEYMVPDVFTQLEILPLTQNGKLNRAALPEPEWTHCAEYVAPRNQAEKQMGDIWLAVLGVDQIGIHDNFFKIGGDSISAIRLSSTALTMSGRDIPLDLLFAHPTIAGLVLALDEQGEQGEQGEEGGISESPLFDNIVEL